MAQLDQFDNSEHFVESAHGFKVGDVVMARGGAYFGAKDRASFLRWWGNKYAQRRVEKIAWFPPGQRSGDFALCFSDVKKSGYGSLENFQVVIEAAMKEEK